MRNIISIASVVFLLFCASCSKDSTTNPTKPPVSTDPKITWTYLGTTYTASSIVATKAQTTPFALPNVINATSSGLSLVIKISALDNGNYTDQTPGNNTMAYQNYGFDSYTLSITSSSGSTITGTFTGIYQGQQFSGTFANITFQ